MSKRIPIIVMSVLIIISLILSFGAGCAISGGNQNSSGPGLNKISEVWDLIYRDYVDKTKLNSENLTEAAIKGILEALDDPYTTYLKPEIYQIATSDIQGKFDGIGATVGLRNDQITIIAPMPDSPAAKAGIKSGDVILEIDGVSTAGISVTEAVLKIRGPKGTPVKLFVLHQGAANPVEIEIIRAEIKITSVQSEMKGDIAHIIINSFSDTTDEELIPVLENISRSEAKGIILDLRSNPGGLLNEVVDVASHFIKDGVVVSVVDNRGGRSSQSVKSTNVFTDLPMVVLTDNYSASGSEVLAGALQDHRRATIAGTKTFGKGSVNILHKLQDGSGLYITIARWLTPNGRLIEGEGIEPDIELSQEGDAAIDWAIEYLKGKRLALTSPVFSSFVTR